MTIILYDRDSFEKINWSKKKYGYDVKYYFQMMMQKDSSVCIQNVYTNVYILEIDDILLPISVNESTKQSIDKKVGLYRMLSSLITEESIKHQFLLNQSAGAGHFKRYRGAKGEMEYTMIHTKHLSFKRKFSWKLLSFLVEKIGEPLVKKMEK